MKQLITSGAKGTEYHFAEFALGAGIPVKTFSYEGDNIITEFTDQIELLTEPQLHVPDTLITLIRRKSGLIFPDNEVRRNIIRKYYWIVRAAKTLIVVGELKKSVREMRSGKGDWHWAIEMAKFWDIPVCVFDTRNEMWQYWDPLAGCWLPTFENNPPKMPETFSAAGTKALCPAGSIAIQSFFETHARHVELIEEQR